jgi:hypothetical protein
LKRSVALRWPEWLLETSQFPVLVVPKGQTERLAYISEFVEAAKSSGLVQRAIDRAGRPGYHVAAPGNAGGAPAAGR